MKFCSYCRNYPRHEFLRLISLHRSTSEPRALNKMTTMSTVSSMEAHATFCLLARHVLRLRVSAWRHTAAALPSPTTSGLQTDDDYALMHSANYMAARPPPPPAFSPLPERVQRDLDQNTHMCVVHIYTHMYTCIHMRGLRLLLPSPRLPASLHRVWPATMITRLTATSRLRQLCGRFFYFSIVMMILVCTTFAFVNYVSALPPPPPLFTSSSPVMLGVR